MEITTAQDATQSNVPPGVIDLGVGHPGPDLLPMELMQHASEHRFAAGARSFLQYGIEAGSPHFRALLAEFLTGSCGTAVESASLCITNGVSQALDLLCTLHTRPGDVVLVEEPSYFLALRIFADHGLRVVGVAIDGDGLLPEALEEALVREKPRFLYTIPTHQNPAGVTLSARRRERVVELCAAHGCLVVADEVYHLLSYGPPPPAPFAAWCGEPHIISLGSFSKILAPGLRLGWLQASPAQIARVTTCGLLDSGGGLNPFTGAMVQSVLEMELLRPHVERLRQAYGSRMRALCTALSVEVGSLACFEIPSGGYFVWLEANAAVDSRRLSAACDGEKVGLRAGERFSTQGKFGNCVRLCFAYYGEAELVEGARRLGAALRACNTL